MSEIDSIQIHLSSKDATSYNNNLTSDCNFNLPLIEVPSQHYLYMSVIHAVIPYSFYQINSSNNNLYYSIIISGVQTIQPSLTITPGNYNVRQLASFLNSNLPNFTVTYNSITNAFLFNNTTNNFIFSSTSTCLKLLGFISNTLYLTSYGVSPNYQLISYQSIDLMPYKCICILSNFPSGGINLSNKSAMSVLISLPIKSSPYSIITYDGDTSNQQCLYTNSLSSLQIKITDQNNSPINLNGIDWAITLQLNVIKFVE